MSIIFLNVLVVAQGHYTSAGGIPVGGQSHAKPASTQSRSVKGPSGKGSRIKWDGLSAPQGDLAEIRSKIRELKEVMN